MNTFSGLRASRKCPYRGNDFVTDRMAGLQQSFAGALAPVA